VLVQWILALCFSIVAGMAFAWLDGRLQRLARPRGLGGMLLTAGITLFAFALTSAANIGVLRQLPAVDGRAVMLAYLAGMALAWGWRGDHSK